MISIVLPIAQNESGEKIKRCLDSLAYQTYQDFEVIIVTFPKTAETLSSLFKKYSFVKVLSVTGTKPQPEIPEQKKPKASIYSISMPICGSQKIF